MSKVTELENALTELFRKGTKVGYSETEIDEFLEDIDYDSANPTDNDLTPFLNIMNEWYAKDTSNKIKAVFKSRMQKGLRCSGSIPYGYKRTKDDKQQLYVDEPAAEVVRRIFRMACQGIGTTTIAEILTAEQVLIPSAYTAKTSPENCRNKDYADPYRWSATTVGYHPGDHLLASFDADTKVSMVIDRVDEDDVWYTMPSVPEQEAVSMERTSFERYMDQGNITVVPAEQAIAAEKPEPVAETPAAVYTETPYKVGDTVYLDDTLFEITEVGDYNVQLRDPALA